MIWFRGVVASPVIGLEAITFFKKLVAAKFFRKRLPRFFRVLPRAQFLIAAKSLPRTSSAVLPRSSATLNNCTVQKTAKKKNKNHIPKSFSQPKLKIRRGGFTPTAIYS